MRGKGSVQFSLVAQSCPLFATPWIAARQASLSITNSWSSPKFTSIESVMPSSHLILCRPLLLLPPLPPSIRVFSKSQLFTWGGRSTGVSALTSVLLKNTQGWSPLEWTGWISLEGLSGLSAKTRPGADSGSDHELLIAKFRLTHLGPYFLKWQYSNKWIPIKVIITLFLYVYI